jgi:hypothetical protein
MRIGRVGHEHVAGTKGYLARTNPSTLWRTDGGGVGVEQTLPQQQATAILLVSQLGASTVFSGFGRFTKIGAAFTPSQVFPTQSR